MLTDTVGFIQKLPTNLVAAFRATLEEVSHDILFACFSHKYTALSNAPYLLYVVLGARGAPY